MLSPESIHRTRNHTYENLSQRSSKKHRVSEDRDERHAREAVFRLARVKREERAPERNIVSRTIQL